jgi:murein L,D-transpeptidase YcbB/YkuD
VAGGLTRAADRGAAAAYLQGLTPPAREYGQLRDALARYRAFAAGGDVDAGARAQQIAVNMERLRWFPHAPGIQYILVNVPGASLALMESGQPTLVSRVVVGARDKTTPILSTEAVSVTINPAWHVPASIVRREIRPKGSGYLAAKNMYVRDGQVIQRPGLGNALGVVKFEMPNDFNVYLHDTPTKKAFLSEDRAVSHGCVRVQQIRSLASHVLGLSEQDLQRLIARGRTDGLRLAAPIPVHIQYWTAVPREDGHIAFLDDVYGRDARMIRAMFPSPAPQLVASR